MNVQKIIVREGLILLCLLVLFGACNYAVMTLPHECQGVFQVKYNKRLYQITTYDYNLFAVRKGLENKVGISDFLKKTGLKEPVDPLAPLEVKNIGEKCPSGKKWYDLASLALLMILFTYPVYVLSQLILWAFKALRKQQAD